jgi:hypothetical protein
VDRLSDHRDKLITDTQPLVRPIEPPRRSFDYRRGTRALQVAAACLALAVVGGLLGVVLAQPGPVASQTTEQLTPLGTVIPETTTTGAAVVTPSTASTPLPVVQPARVTTVWRAPVQSLRPVPVVTSTTAPPPQVVIVPPVEPTVETKAPTTTTRSRRAIPPPRASESRTREPQEPYEPQDPPLFDLGGLLP